MMQLPFRLQQHCAPKGSTLLVHLCLFTLLLVATPASAFGTRVDAGQRECLVESIAAGGSLAFTFRVTDGGSFDIDVTMYATTVAPLGKMEETTRMHYNTLLMNMRDNTTTALVNEWRRASEGSQSYTAPTAAETKHGLPAEVTVCFDNSFSRVAPKWVLFQFLKRDVVEIDPDSLTKAEAEIEKKLHNHGKVLFELAVVAERMRQVGESDHVKYESVYIIVTAGLIGNILILLIMAIYQYKTMTRFLRRCRTK
ncbi:transmembrane emp24 domain trafficking protein 2 [Trypanosoma grayi]|uniref:transmembrane emp24 domain trafficking protein 2 n=1 Tax=Trypanosoma grayi TaxID=71804 RepID=UPI0004F42C71|nr:transmembrane emp24 domain trafficking protein 2 [Trypanosoma grayi]KEG07375.1 transmembrane emp24 domain trafficking protein 2 [Trypanosoma grayi]